MAPHVAVILVHYHAAELTRSSVLALGDDLKASGVCAEWLVVDNGSSERERALLASLPVLVLDAGGNRGYAGGVNLGAAHASADTLLLVNPDVVVFPGCVPRLLAELRAGAAVAGPQFYWDSRRRFLLPPAEERSLASEFRRSLAWRGPALAGHARRRWRRHARRHWQAPGPIASHELSGALLALSRDAWRAVGPFDEGYRLYFEETQWLERARRAGLSGRFVPEAHALHLAGQSAQHEPSAPLWFADSARRFRGWRHGAFWGRVLEVVDSVRRRQPPTLVPETLRLRLPDGGERCGAWIEISPLWTGFPAAAERITVEGFRDWSLPDEVWQHLAPGTWRLQVVADNGVESQSLAFEKRSAG